MARAFRRRRQHYVATLDDAERTVLAGLMQQTRALLAPDREPTGDAFADLVASMGVSLASDEQRSDDQDEGAGGRGQPGETGAEGKSTESPDHPGLDPIDRDPALDRLLPTAHRGDDQVAAEFRRLTEQGLRQRKSANLDIAVAALEAAGAASTDQVTLDAAQATAFLMALTDVRLLLGERMGMRTEEDAERLHQAMSSIADDDPLGYAMAWYDFLTWMQEGLTHAVMGR